MIIQVGNGTIKTLMPDQLGKLRFAIQMALYKETGLGDWEIQVEGFDVNADLRSNNIFIVRALYAVEISHNSRKRTYQELSFKMCVNQLRVDTVFINALEEIRKCLLK